MEKTIIDANKSILSLDLKEILRYKDLFYTLAYRDFKARYAQTFLGLAWGIFKPILTLAVFAVIFGRGLSVDTGGVPYTVFALCGMSVWSYFSFVLSNAGGSIIGSQDIVQKVYFPRLILPFSKAVVGLIDYIIALLLLVGLMIYFQVPASSNIIYMPLFLIMAIITSLGLGVWLSALTIRFRDFQQLIPFMVQIGTYLTPVAYPPELVLSKFPSWARIIYFANPMAGVVQGFRWSILGGDTPSVYVYFSFAIVIILFITSLFYFKKVEKVIADIV